VLGKERERHHARGHEGSDPGEQSERDQHAGDELEDAPSGPAAAAGQWPYFYAGPTGSIIPMVSNGEPAVLYCFAFLLLVFTGGGAIALDARSSGTSRPALRRNV
jgi:putative oxidoreductase